MENETKWGRLLRKKIKKYTGPQGQNLLKGKTYPQRGRTNHDHEVRVVTITDSLPGSLGTCPQCKKSSAELGVDTAPDLQIHTFSCRLDSGVDPLLPVVSLRPSPPTKGKTSWDPSPVPMRKVREEEVELPKAALRSLLPPKLQQIRPKPPKRRVECSSYQKANALALTRLVAAQKGRQKEGHTERLLRSLQQGEHLDFSDVTLTPEDCAVVGAILADHPRLAAVEFGDVDASVRPVLERILFTAAAENPNLLSIQQTHQKGLFTTKGGKAVESQVDVSLSGHYTSIQQGVLERLTASYEVWKSGREAAFTELLKEENVARNVVRSEQKAAKGVVVMQGRSEVAVIRKKRERMEEMERRRLQKEALYESEGMYRGGVVGAEIARRIALLELRSELVANAYLADLEAAERRKIKSLEELSHRTTKQTERSRFAREARARAMVEDLQQDGRATLFEGYLFGLSNISSELDAGIAYMRFIETQEEIQKELKQNYTEISRQIKSDEAEGRKWIVERRTFVIQLKEQEKAKSRQIIYTNEDDVREALTQKLLKLLGLIFEEVEANLLWIHQHNALTAVDNEFSALMNEPPRLSFRPNLTINSKPNIFFVGPNASPIDDKVAVSTTASINVNLTNDWTTLYTNLLAKRKETNKIERDAFSAYQRIKQKGEKAMQAVEEEKDAKPEEQNLNPGREKRKKTMRLLQTAVKFGGAAAPRVRSSSAKQTESAEAAECRKTKVRGGRIIFSLLPNRAEGDVTPKAPDSSSQLQQQSLPEDLYSSLRLTTSSTHYSTRVDESDIRPPRSPRAEPHKGDWCVPNTVAECFGGKVPLREAPSSPKSGRPLIGFGDVQVPAGKHIEIVLTGEEDEALGCECLSAAVRSCSLYSTSDRLEVPCIVQVLARLELDFGGKFLDDGVTETFLTCTSTVVSDVVLAVPFIQYPNGVVQREFVEGMKSDELQLVPDQFVLTDPPTIIARQLGSKSQTFTVMAGGQQGGGLSLSNFHDAHIILATRQGLSKEDVLCFKNSNKLFFDNPHTLKLRDSGKEYSIGEVIRGKMHTCVDTYNRECTAEQLVVIHLSCEANPGLLAAENVRLLVRGLRFANTSSAPVEGKRQMLLQIADSRKSFSTLPIIVNVIGHDDPTEMTIPSLKIVVRPSQVPEKFKQYLSPTIFPLAENASVVDVDTDAFLGGSLHITLTGGTKGEGISLMCGKFPEKGEECSGGTTMLKYSAFDYHNDASDRLSTPPEAAFKQVTLREPQTPLASSEVSSSCPHGVMMDMLNANDLLKVRDNVLYYDVHPIGTVTKGAVTIDEQHESDGVHELHIDFVTTGRMTIALCQLLLRRVALTTYKPSLQGVRTCNVTLTIGETSSGDTTSLEENENGEGEALKHTPEPSCVLTEKVTVRHAANLLTIPEKYTQVEYREGSGAQRLAPFELVQDKSGHVENYNNGYISVEIVEGVAEDDSLALREDENIKLVPPKHVPERGKRMQNTTHANRHQSVLGLKHALESRSIRPTSPLREVSDPPNAALPQPLTSPKGKPKMRFADFKEKLRDHLTHEAQERLANKEDLIGLAQNVAADKSAQNLVKEKEAAVREKFPVKMDVVMEAKTVAVLTRESPGCFQLQFRPEAGVNVTRRNVLTILRNLTYTNCSSDPQVLKKMLRLTISDQPPCFSQSIFEISIQTVCTQ